MQACHYQEHSTQEIILPCKCPRIKCEYVDKFPEYQISINTKHTVYNAKYKNAYVYTCRHYVAIPYFLLVTQKLQNDQEVYLKVKSEAKLRRIVENTCTLEEVLAHKSWTFLRFNIKDPIAQYYQNYECIANADRERNILYEL